MKNKEKWKIKMLEPWFCIMPVRALFSEPTLRSKLIFSDD